MKDKVAMAIERIRSFQPTWRNLFASGEGYYLAFSGGKDSITIKALADEAGVKYDAHYMVTGIDPPDLVRFIREYHPDVEWHHPARTIFRMMLEKGFPPMRNPQSGGRWCCALLKERGGDGRFVMQGVRWAESHARENRRWVEHCLKGGNKRYLNPIIDWTDEDVWAYIRDRKLPYCKLYDEGWKRIGCLFCPMAHGNRKLHLERYPRYAQLWIKAFDKLLELRRKRGKPMTWTTGQEMFDWWLSDKENKGTTSQEEDLPLFA